MASVKKPHEQVFLCTYVVYVVQTIYTSKTAYTTLKTKLSTPPLTKRGCQDVIADIIVGRD
jgi:hypothetical protein